MSTHYNSHINYAEQFGGYFPEKGTYNLEARSISENKSQQRDGLPLTLRRYSFPEATGITELCVIGRSSVWQ